MIALAAALVPFAESVGMKVPKDPDNFDRNAYPHFFVYLQLQIGRPILRNRSHVENAKIITSISNAEIRKITFPELIMMGVE